MESFGPEERRSRRTTVPSDPDLESDEPINWHPATTAIVNRERLTTGYPPIPRQFQPEPTPNEPQRGHNAGERTSQSTQPTDVPVNPQVWWLNQAQQQSEAFGDDPSYYLDVLARVFTYLQGQPLDLGDLIALRDRTKTPFEVCMRYNPQMGMMLLERWQGGMMAQQEPQQSRGGNPRDGTVPPELPGLGLSAEVRRNGSGGRSSQRRRRRASADYLVRPSGSSGNASGRQ